MGTVYFETSARLCALHIIQSNVRLRVAGGLQNVHWKSLKEMYVNYLLID
jgi:hypothetical protein